MTPPRRRGKSAPFRLWTAAIFLYLSGVSLAGTALTIEPPSIRLAGRDDRQQLVVTSAAADGTLHDVGAAARYRVESPATIAEVSPGGLVTPRNDGTGRLIVEHDGQSVAVPIVVESSGADRPVSYRRDVTALLSRAGCNMGTCHGNLNGKGGLRLSLRGDDPGFDFRSLTRDSFGRRIDGGHPEASLLVLKPTGQLPHEGGLRFPADSPESRVLRAWIAAGARDDASSVVPLSRLTVYPRERIAAAPALSQQLLVMAEFADGSRRDVTREASYDVSDPTRAAVTASGQVRASGPCEVAVAVRYLGGRGTSRLAFLPERPGFAWEDVPAKTSLDAAHLAQLKSLRIQPSKPADDPTFLRRAYLDALGVLPSVDEARAFLADSRPEKRGELVDRLVARPEFADFWALKWADLLRNEEKTMGQKGVWVFQRWLRDQVAKDVPLDEFARSIVSSRGSTWRNPPASFYRTNRDPQAAAEAIGQVFLGVRLQCARCHSHPFDVWTQDDYYGLAAYFANLGRKQIANDRRDKFDTHEINGDEVVYRTGRAEMIQPRTGEMMEPKPPGGPRPELCDGHDALDALAGWLTRDNPQFARNLANRVWFHLIGRGIVDPVDDFRESNPPANPALLDALTDEFVRGGMRLKPLVRLIMKSRVYELSSRPNPTNADDDTHFSRATVRLLPAEVLMDAMSQALGQGEDFPTAPRAARAVQLAGAKMGGTFLKVFGKPDRLLTCECERSESTTLAQAFQLINGETVRSRLEAPDNRLGRLIAAGASTESIVDEVYLAALCRHPADREREAAVSHVAKAKDRRKALEDVTWAVLNSKEFLLRH